MGNNKKNKPSKKQKLNIAENAIRKIAIREGVTVDHVRKQIRIAMINGLCSSNSEVKAFWDSIPREKELPTPEELIIYISDSPELIKREREQDE